MALLPVILPLASNVSLPTVTSPNKLILFEAFNVRPLVLFMETPELSVILPLPFPGNDFNSISVDVS